MKRIEGISSQPKQQTTLSLADGSRATLTLEYKAQQKGWFYDLVWGVVRIKGQRLVASPNIFRQYLNLIPFGIAVLTPNNVDPYGQDALTTATLLLLEGDDLALIEQQAFDGPVGPVQPVNQSSSGSAAIVLPPQWGPAGGDLAGNYPNPIVRAITETSGPQSLSVGAIVDGEFLKRVGDQIISGVVSAGNGWSPVLAVVTDGARRVFQIVNWVGGSGSMPAVGDYIGPVGLVSTAAAAVDVRGATGAGGAAGAPGSVLRNGSGVPSNSLGIDGDYYLNDANGDVYLKASGAYTVVANIAGPAGSPGSPGIGVALTGPRYGRMRKKISGTITSSADTDWALMPVFYPDDYYVVVNSTSDAAANVTKMNALITDLVAAGGGLIDLPPGTVYLNDRLTISGAVSVKIRGQGSRVSQIMQTSGTKGIFNITLTRVGSYIESVIALEGMTLGSNVASTIITAQPCVFLDNAAVDSNSRTPGATLRDVVFCCDAAAACYGKFLSLGNINNVTVDNCTLMGGSGDNTGTVGLRVEPNNNINIILCVSKTYFRSIGIGLDLTGNTFAGSPQGIFVEGCNFLVCGKGIAASYLDELAVVNCEFDCLDYQIWNDASFAADSVTVLGCLFLTGRTASMTAIYGAFTRSIFSNNVFYGGVSGAKGIDIEGDQNLVTGNVFDNFEGFNVKTRGTNITVRSNSVVPPGSPPADPYPNPGGNTNLILSEKEGACVVATLSSNQSIPTATTTAVSWAAASPNDFGMWVGGSPTRLTVPYGARRVRLTLNVKWGSSSTGYRYIQVKKNGSTQVGGQNTTANLDSQGAVTTRIVEVSSGDYFEGFVEQNTGGALDVAASGETSFSMEVVA